MSKNRKKMTLKDYYDSIDDTSPKMKFKEQIIKECGISHATFYNWMNGSSEIPKTSKERISEITGIPVDELCPNPVTA